LASTRLLGLQVRCKVDGGLRDKGGATGSCSEQGRAVLRLGYRGFIGKCRQQGRGWNGTVRLTGVAWGRKRGAQRIIDAAVSRCRAVPISSVVVVVRAPA
jgi:hypothetical protein